MSKQGALPYTGERFVPEIEGTSRLEHLHRYHLAAMLAKDRDVLDLACGEGYGSDLIAGNASSVTGVDISEEAVEHAAARYNRENLRFLQGSATDVPCEDDSFDLVVSFETIEHLVDHEAMLLEFRRVLKADGLLLISSPNKEIYSDRVSYDNPFHLKELYTSEFKELVSAQFSNIAHMGQRVSAASIIATTDCAETFVSLADGVAVPGVSAQRYDLLLASDGLLPSLPHSTYHVDGSVLNPEAAETHIANLVNALDKLTAENKSLTEQRAEFEKLSIDLQGDLGRADARVRELQAALHIIRQTLDAT